MDVGQPSLEWIFDKNILRIDGLTHHVISVHPDILRGDTCAFTWIQLGCEDVGMWRDVSLIAKSGTDAAVTCLGCLAEG